MMDLFIRWSDTPFQYGSADCCQFVGECLERRFGVNPAQRFEYGGANGADDLIERYGGLSQLLDAVLGESHPDAMDGNVALIDDQQVVGYVYGDRIVARAKTGLMDLPLNRSSRFWSWRNS